MTIVKTRDSRTYTWKLWGWRQISSGVHRVILDDADLVINASRAWEEALTRLMRKVDGGSGKETDD